MYVFIEQKISKESPPAGVNFHTLGQTPERSKAAKGPDKHVNLHMEVFAWDSRQILG